MERVANWLTYLFRSTNGLVLVAMSITAAVTAVLGTLSGPMAEWGVKEIMVKLVGFDLRPLERVGRLVILYHAIAMAVIAIEVYFITAILPGGLVYAAVKKGQLEQAKAELSEVSEDIAELSRDLLAMQAVAGELTMAQLK